MKKALLYCALITVIASIVYATYLNSSSEKQDGESQLEHNDNIELYNAKTKEICDKAGRPVIPASDQPTQDETKAFKDSRVDCSSFKAGLGAQQDWNNYRKCVLSQDEINNNDIAEIYANGWGIKRNPKLAIAFVCSGDAAPAELDSMVEALDLTKTEEHLKEEFNFCNYATSGRSAGYCAAKSEADTKKKRELELSALTAGWTPEQKQLFDTLQKTADDFFSERASSEQDMSGTARAQIAIDEESRLKNEFLNHIKALESGQSKEDVDFLKADQDLNMLYSQIMNKTKIDEYGTITKDGIKSTQRKWIKYRDAWAKFIELRYPNYPSDSFKALLTEERIAQLREFV